MAGSMIQKGASIETENEFVRQPFIKVTHDSVPASPQKRIFGKQRHFIKRHETIQPPERGKCELASTHGPLS
jgi:hypothetical protein